MRTAWQNIRREICGGGSCSVRIGRESSLIYGAFMLNESSDPVTSDSVSKHRIIICSTLTWASSCSHCYRNTFAGRDQVVLAILGNIGEVEVCNRSRMAVAGERNILLRNLRDDHSRCGQRCGFWSLELEF